MKLYVASSWRCDDYLKVLYYLRKAGHECYDFRDPALGGGFGWSSIDPKWQDWNFDQYAAAMRHELAVKAFDSDMGAMEWADGCVLVQPCGVSAHLEAGWFAGACKPVVSIGKPREADLMLCALDALFPYDGVGVTALLDWLQMETYRLAKLKAELRKSITRMHGPNPCTTLVAANPVADVPLLPASTCNLDAGRSFEQLLDYLKQYATRRWLDRFELSQRLLTDTRVDSPE